MMYGVKGEVPDGEHLVPLGVAEVKRPGKDVTIVSFSKPVRMVLEAAEALAARGDRGRGRGPAHHTAPGREGDLRLGGEDESLRRRGRGHGRLPAWARTWRGSSPATASTTWTRRWSSSPSEDVPMPYNHSLELAAQPSVAKIVEAVKGCCMPEKILMIALSPTMETGTLARWRKKEGDTSPAATCSARWRPTRPPWTTSPAAEGTLLKILLPEGGQAKVGDLIAIVGKPGEDISGIMAGLGSAPAVEHAPARGAAAPSAPALTPAPAGVACSPEPFPENRRAGGQDQVLTPCAQGRGPEGRRPPLPRGSGPAGRIVMRDLEKLPAAPAREQTGAAIGSPAARRRRRGRPRLTDAQGHRKAALGIDVQRTALLSHRGGGHGRASGRAHEDERRDARRSFPSTRFSWPLRAGRLPVIRRSTRRGTGTRSCGTPRQTSASRWRCRTA